MSFSSRWQSPDESTTIHGHLPTTPMTTSSFSYENDTDGEEFAIARMRYRLKNVSAIPTRDYRIPYFGWVVVLAKIIIFVVVFAILFYILYRLSRGYNSLVLKRSTKTWKTILDKDNAQCVERVEKKTIFIVDTVTDVFFIPTTSPAPPQIWQRFCFCCQEQGGCACVCGQHPCACKQKCQKSKFYLIVQVDDRTNKTTPINTPNLAQQLITYDCISGVWSASPLDSDCRDLLE